MDSHLPNDRLVVGVLQYVSDFPEDYLVAIVHVELLRGLSRICNLTDPRTSLDLRDLYNSNRQDVVLSRITKIQGRVPGRGFPPRTFTRGRSPRVIFSETPSDHRIKLKVRTSL